MLTAIGDTGTHIKIPSSNVWQLNDYRPTKSTGIQYDCVVIVFDL